MMEVDLVPRRPSLYTAIRLARIIQNVRERLKARVLTRARKNALEVLGDCSVEKVWRENMIGEAYAVPAAIPKSRGRPRAVSGKDTNFAGLLQDLDCQISSGGSSISGVAAQDQLFLKQTTVDFKQKQLRDISHVFDVSTALLDRVQLARTEELWKSPQFKHLDAEECSKYLANLEHMLLCLQQAALEALVNHSLHKLQSDYQHWDRYLEQRKRVHGGCFSEWVGGKPPLNSTMPWNIKPSLVVLWGVCWMFYNHVNDNSVSPQGARRPREATEPGWGQGQQQTQAQTQAQQQQWGQADMINYGLRPQSAHDSRIRQTPPHHQHANPQVSQAQINALGPAGLGLHVTTHQGQQQAYQGNMANMAPGMTQSAEALPLNAYRGVVDSSTSSSFASELQATLTNPPTLPSQQQQQHAPQVTRSASAHAQLQNAAKSGPYIRTNIINTPSSSSDASFATPSPAWPHHQDQGSSHNYVSQVWPPNSDNTNISTPAPNFSYPASATSSSSHAAFDFPAATSSVQNFYNSGFPNPSQYRNYSSLHQNQLGIPMNDPQAYPSPHSEGQGRAASIAVDNLSPSNMASEISPTDWSPNNRRNSGGFANREAPRNQLGVIYCDHSECAADPPTFSRKCEWTKHMDKHTRPYVCHQPGCEKIRGFTYSGGLLRHEREVHKKYGGPKAPRFCPHRDCKRSTGTGFSRKENLHEHLRRVHRGVGIEDEGGDSKADDDDGERDDSTSRARTNTMSTTLGGLGDEGEGSSRKRKKASDGEESLRDTIEELTQTNKRLRIELAQKDQRLKVLEDVVMRSITTQGIRPGSMG